MPKLERCVLRDSAARIPMPDRGGRLFSPAGETVDVEDRFYATLIADRDIVFASRAASSPAGDRLSGKASETSDGPQSRPAGVSGASRVRAGQSPLLPSADHEATRKGKRT